MDDVGILDSRGPQERVFVGRASELALLSNATELVRQGKAQVVWIEGDAGCGKTGLLNAWLAGLAADFQVLRAEADELARDHPLELANQLGHFSAADGFGVGMEVLDLVDRAQHSGPVVVVVEDLHWADLASRQALLTAARRLRSDRSLILITSRAAVRDDGWERFTTDPDRCLRINLGALTVEDVGELARACGTRLNRRSVERLHRHTRGHALYARTLLAELTREQLRASEGELPAPRSLASTTVARMAQATPAAQRLGFALAVLNGRLALGVVAGVADVLAPDSALEALLETGLVTWYPSEVGTPVEYAHPLYRAAIYDDLSPTVRQQLHLAAAEGLDQQAALVHRVAASDGRDVELTDELVALARSTERRHELGLAATYWLWVSSLSAERAVSENALLQCARLLIADGQSHRAHALQSALEATSASALRSLLLGAIAWDSGDAIRAEAHLNDALASADADDSPSNTLRVEALVRLATLLVIDGRGVEALDAAQEALARPLANPSLEAQAWSQLVRAEAHVRGAASGLTLLAGRLGGDPATARAGDIALLVTRGVLGFYGGRNTQATADLRNVLRLVRQGGFTADLPRVHLQLAQLLIIGGEWDEALVHARLGLSLVDDGGQVWVETQAHAALASVLASRGEWTAAAVRAKSARAAADIVGTLEARFLAHIAESALARAKGDAAGVVASLGPLVGTGESTRMTMLTSLGWWPVLIHALIDVGDLPSAERHLRQLRMAASDRSIEVGARTQGLEARLSLASGDADQATAQFLQSLDLFGADDALLDWAAIHHYFGRLLQARGKRQLAVDQLRSAYNLYSAAKAEPYMHRVRVDLSRSGIAEEPARTRSALALTEREQDVVALVRKGMTNRQVASELYISSKAVEYHLRNVFGKLGVTSRAALRAT